MAPRGGVTSGAGYKWPRVAGGQPNQARQTIIHKHETPLHDYNSSFTKEKTATITPSTKLHTNQTLQRRFVNEDTRKRNAMRNIKRKSNAKRGSAKPRCERKKKHGSAQTKSLIKLIGANQLANEGRGSIYWRRARSVKSLSNCAPGCLK